MVLLNPGPVNVSERVRQALLRPDICHRESEFTELLHRIQSKLLKAFVPGAESEYVAVVMTGSGTATVEAALMSSLPHSRDFSVSLVLFALFAKLEWFLWFSAAGSFIFAGIMLWVIRPSAVIATKI
ncbi:MAG: hypothetical protein HP492_02205 [Nitrospira sp.]|nr:hypothetical protein [Nitrospira sp.]